MKLMHLLGRTFAGLALAAAAFAGLAADFPALREGSWVVRDFRFHAGEVLPELRLHYRTVGAPTGELLTIAARDATLAPIVRDFARATQHDRGNFMKRRADQVIE